MVDRRHCLLLAVGAHAGQQGFQQTAPPRKPCHVHRHLLVWCKCFLAFALCKQMKLHVAWLSSWAWWVRMRAGRAGGGGVAGKACRIRHYLLVELEFCCWVLGLPAGGPAGYMCILSRVLIFKGAYQRQMRPALQAQGPMRNSHHQCTCCWEGYVRLSVVG